MTQTLERNVGELIICASTLTYISTIQNQILITPAMVRGSIHNKLAAYYAVTPGILKAEDPTVAPFTRAPVADWLTVDLLSRYGL